MSVLSSAHVHTTYCDGKTPAAEMARAAYEKGFLSLGFSSHAPQDFDPGYCIPPEREDAYRREILALKAQYAGRMTIYLGIERDHYACVSPAGYDYFLSAVHYFRKPDGTYAAIDAAPETLGNYVRDCCGGDGLRMARQYFTMLRDDVIATRAPIIAHFDLLRKNNSALHLYDEESPAYRNMALDALRPLADTGALLEVNTGAIARGYLTTPYPAPFLLKAWRAWGGQVIINSDCHNALFLDTYFRESEALLLSLGYDHALRLGKDTLWEAYPLGE